ATAPGGAATGCATALPAGCAGGATRWKDEFITKRPAATATTSNPSRIRTSRPRKAPWGACSMGHLGNGEGPEPRRLIKDDTHHRKSGTPRHSLRMGRTKQ